jgi:hypothetical protein
VRRLLLVAALCFSAFDAGALFPLREGYTKVQLLSSDGRVAAKLPELVNGLALQVLRQYGPDGILLYVSDGVLPELRARAAAASIQFRVDDDRMSVGGILLDPRLGIPATVPESERFTEYPPGREGLYLVQFIGPILPEWVAAMRAIGFEDVEAAYVRPNAVVLAATPEEAAQARSLDFLQWLDFWHPFMKTESLDFRHPRIRYGFEAEMPAVAGAEEAMAELRTLARNVVMRTPTRFYFEIPGAAWPAVRRNRLLLFASLARLAWPDVDAVLPRRARPGDEVILFGGNFQRPPRVLFGGQPSPHVERVDAQRVRVIVPTMPDGPADVLVEADGSTQVLPHDAPNGFAAGSSGPGALTSGDVVTFGILIGNFNVISSQLEAQTPDGVRLARVFGRGARSMFVDVDGMLQTYGNDFVQRLDARLLPASDGPERLRSAWKVLPDDVGNLIVQEPGRVAKYSPGGELLGTYSGACGLIDVDTGGCTLLCGTAGGLGFANVCDGSTGTSLGITGVQDADFAHDGTLVVVSSTSVNRYRRDGTLLASHPYLALWGRLAFTADPRIALLNASSELWQYDLERETLTRLPRRGNGRDAFLVYGGWTAARGYPSYAAEPVITAIDPDGTIRGNNFVPGVTVTVNGVAVRVQFGDAQTLRIAAPPPGAFVVVAKPNGQRATWGSAHAGHDVPLDARALMAMLAVLAIAAVIRLR